MCKNPWRNCKNTDTAVFIIYKDKMLSICRACWARIGKSNKEW